MAEKYFLEIIENGGIQGQEGRIPRYFIIAAPVEKYDALSREIATTKHAYQNEVFCQEFDFKGEVDDIEKIILETFRPLAITEEYKKTGKIVRREFPDHYLAKFDPNNKSFSLRVGMSAKSKEEWEALGEGLCAKLKAA